jgi:hypothetical protein
MFSVGLLGATFVPKIVVNLSAGGTVQQSLYIVLGMAIALFVVSLFLGMGGGGDRKSAAAARQAA